jgi:hypothetical protein
MRLIRRKFIAKVKGMSFALNVDNNHGLIFPSSIMPISGSAKAQSELDFYEIVIIDKNSKEVYRQLLRANGSSIASFTWDLKKSGSYVESGCYTINLVDGLSKSNVCSAECKVIDTRKILSTTRSLRLSPALAPNISQTLLSTYFDIIHDIQAMILERLERNGFEESYFVACITLGFIQEIANDMKDQSKSRFIDRIAEFQAKNPASKQTRLGLRPLFDFLINYMADLEDHARANAMARCGQRRITRHDKSQIISSLVLAIYPYCNTISFSRNVIGSVAGKITGSIIKLEIDM